MSNAQAKSIFELDEQFKRHIKSFEKQYEYDTENNYMEDEEAWRNINEEIRRIYAGWKSDTKARIIGDSMLSNAVRELIFIEKLKGNIERNNWLLELFCYN